MKEKLKNKKFMMSVISVIGFIVIVIITVLALNRSKLKLKAPDFAVEYGKTVSMNVEDYLDVEENNLKQSILDKAVLKFDIQNEEQKDYPAIGEYDASIVFEKDEVKFKIIVKDTVAPVFKEFKDTIETVKDVKPDYTKEYVAEDLSQVEITCDDQEVKYDVVGEYKATMKAIDTSKNETSKEITIKVTEPTLKLDKTSLSLYVKENYVFKTEIKGKDTKAIYKSSDDKIASVDENGKVTAKKKGTANIVAEANGVKAECKVTVKEAPLGSNTSTQTITNPTTGKKEEVIVVKPSKPSGTNSSGTSMSYNIDSAKEAFHLQNQKRNEAGTHNLIWDNTLYEACKIRAKEASVKTSHTRPDGRDCFTVLTDIGYQTDISSIGHYFKAGENLAWGFNNASGAIDWWYSSQGHKENMLNTEFTKGAIARYGNYWIALFSNN